MKQDLLTHTSNTHPNTPNAPNNTNTNTHINPLSIYNLRPTVLLHYLISIAPIQLPSPYEQLYNPNTINTDLNMYIIKLTQIQEGNSSNNNNTNSNGNNDSSSSGGMSTILYNYPYNTHTHIQSHIQSQSQPYNWSQSHIECDAYNTVIQDCLDIFINRIANTSNNTNNTNSNNSNNISNNNSDLRSWYECILECSITAMK